MATNIIYQYSIISALMSGLASEDVSCTISNLLENGDFGIGTFEDLDGEMVVVDSKAYQFHSDGTTNEVSPDQLAPFAMVTRFEPTESGKIMVANKSDFEKKIRAVFPNSKNAFVLFRAQGHFDKVKIRAVHKQDYLGQTLVEVTEHQTIKEFEGPRGTIVGLISPKWTDGMSVAGFHAHFIDDERKFGGHILELSASDPVHLEVALSSRFHLELPRCKRFGDAVLELDKDGIQKAEG